MNEEGKSAVCCIHSISLKPPQLSESGYHPYEGGDRLREHNG